MTGPRASGADDKPDPAIEETTQPPAPRTRPGPRRRGCPTHGRAFAAGNRPDGQPACPLCRRGAPPSAPPDSGDATVIPFPTRTA